MLADMSGGAAGISSYTLAGAHYCCLVHFIAGAHCCCLVPFIIHFLFFSLPPLAIGGSGSTYIYGLVDNKFREGMTKDEAKSMVEKCISHAMARDGSSGGIIRTVVITEDG